MKKPALPGEYPCPVEAALDVIGGKWKGVILWHLHTRGTLRFGELRRLLPARLARQALTVQLRELEADGVIHREAYDQKPPKVEYSLTPLAPGPRSSSRRVTAPTSTPSKEPGANSKPTRARWRHAPPRPSTAPWPEAWRGSAQATPVAGSSTRATKPSESTRN